MASPKEIDLVCDIQRICVQINMQKKLHAFWNYSGHTSGLDVYMYRAPFLSDGGMLEGWSVCDRTIYLSTNYDLSFDETIEDVIAHKVEQLTKLKADLIELLDVDADGVPV
jgi:hypothetical protein